MKRRVDLGAVQTLAVASQLAFVLAACVLIGILGGSYLDTRLGTSPLLLIVGSLLGTVAGVYSVYRTTVFLLARLERKKNSQNPDER